MKYVLQVLLFVFLVYGISLAQVTISATANGTFTMLGYATAQKLADLDFGWFTPGTTVTVEPTQAQAAEFLFNGNSSTSVTVTITFPSTLSSGTSTMNFSNTKSNPIYNTIPDALHGAVEFKHKDGGSATTGTDGNLYIWVGGKVKANAPQKTGTYTGVLHITIVQQ